MKLSAHLAFFDRVSFLDKLLLTKHLAVMIKSGIPLSEAIAAVADQSTNPAFKKVLSDVTAKILNGQSLEKALLTHPEVFDPLFINLVKIGEESGNLEQNLDYLALQLQKDYQFRQKVTAAAMYPAIVLSAAVVVGGGVSFFVLPKLIDLFKSLDTNLPLSTRILLWLSTTMRDYGLFILIGLILLFILFRFIISIPKARIVWQGFLFNIPVLGIFLQNVQLTAFCRNLGIMLKSGLPITTALEAEMSATTNLVFKKYLDKMLQAVTKGKPLGEEITVHNFKFVPRIAAKMIGIGEKTGKLDESLLYLGDFFDDEVDSAAKNFSNVLEPILLLVIGAIVAFVALAVISPIYQFTGSVK